MAVTWSVTSAKKPTSPLPSESQATTRSFIALSFKAGSAIFAFASFIVQIALRTWLMHARRFDGEDESSDFFDDGEDEEDQNEDSDEGEAKEVESGSSDEGSDDDDEAEGTEDDRKSAEE
ncbi:hypothetical protein LTS10_006975 [Elasticomyces elasticus]|nr:hypothetical protein LTS10_006975 [Elasticomyces elasticus]